MPRPPENENQTMSHCPDRKCNAGLGCSLVSYADVRVVRDPASAKPLEDDSHSRKNRSRLDCSFHASKRHHRRIRQFTSHGNRFKRTRHTGNRLHGVMNWLSDGDDWFDGKTGNIKKPPRIEIANWQQPTRLRIASNLLSVRQKIQT